MATNTKRVKITGYAPELPDYMKSESMAKYHEDDSEALNATATAILSVPRLAWAVVMKFCEKYDLLLAEPDDKIHKQHLVEQQPRPKANLN